MTRLLAIVLVAFCCLAGNARAGIALPPVPSVHSSAFLVVDADTGAVLASSNAHAEVPIASLTKLMTVLIALQHHKLTDIVTVDPRAAAVGQSTINLAPDEQLSVHDLVEGALIQSANDAADALALSVAPSFPAFAVLMNAKAKRLGLDDTHFVRPDGLDAPGEYSSAADITKLAQILMRTPFVRETVAKETAMIAGDRTLHTWDDLLGVVPHVIGVKTGHTDDAGWCQVSAVRENGVTIYVTLLGGPSRSIRNEDLISLIDWGEAQFRVVNPVVASRTYATIALPYGRSPLPLVAAGSLTSVARIGYPLTERIVAATGAALPVRKGTVFGRIEIWEGKSLVGVRDLIAAHSVSRPSLAGRLRFYTGRAAHHLADLF